jgi:hypothetical protein
MAVIRGLYYSYTITSQSYLTVRSNGINAFNEPDIVVEPNTAVELVAEYYIGSTAFYITNYYQ